jgi:hypothetical protein
MSRFSRTTDTPSCACQRAAAYRSLCVRRADHWETGGSQKLLTNEELFAASSDISDGDRCHAPPPVWVVCGDRRLRGTATPKPAPDGCPRTRRAEGIQ